MRVLLVHPDHDPVKAALERGRWDRVVDLATTSTGADVERLPELDSADFDHIRNALVFGAGVLIDGHGIDWWDLLSIEFHQWLEKLRVLRRLAASFNSGDEIVATLPQPELRLLHELLEHKVGYLSRPHKLRKTVRARARQFRKFGFRQIVGILGDKYDSSYRLRRLLSPVRRSLRSEVVLAPSSYVNASRGAAACASAVPESDFLLVATRASGMMKALPRNMRSAWLASYALATADHAESASVIAAWEQLQTRLAAHEDWTILARLGVLEGVPSLLRNGLRIRDAWLNVFESANVRAVLCGDEMNPYTRLPVCIAKQRGITALAFHHGAMDGRYRYRENSADLMLAKTQMELDYLVNECGVAEEKIVFVPIEKHGKPQSGADAPKSAIVFFSEPYEIVGGRCRDVYREILPRLSKLATQQHCELVIKLHPQENRREREPIAGSAIERREFRMIEGPLASDLLDRVQLAVTVSSTAAVDCSLRSIPAFVCSWLDHSHYKYGEQFVKFGMAIPVRSPEEIGAIPSLVASHMSARQEVPVDFDMHGSKLRQLLDGTGAQANAATNKVTEPAWA
jgi:hypothetical protein